jgi:hypothetical protein
MEIDGDAEAIFKEALREDSPWLNDAMPLSSTPAVQSSDDREWKRVVLSTTG